MPAVRVRAGFSILIGIIHKTRPDRRERSRDADASVLLAAVDRRLGAQERRHVVAKPFDFGLVAAAAAVVVMMIAAVVVIVAMTLTMPVPLAVTMALAATMVAVLRVLLRLPLLLPVIVAGLVVMLRLLAVVLRRLPRLRSVLLSRLRALLLHRLLTVLRLPAHLNWVLSPRLTLATMAPAAAAPPPATTFLRCPRCP